MFRCRSSDHRARGLVLAAALALASLAARAQATPQVELVMWSAGDCVVCDLWRKGERQAEFNAAAQRSGATLVLVHKPLLRSPDTDFHWPARSPGQPELKGTLQPPRLGLPTFDLLCQGKPVRRLVGLAHWDSYWEKALDDAVRQCAATGAGRASTG